MKISYFIRIFIFTDKLFNSGKMFLGSPALAGLPLSKSRDPHDSAIREFGITEMSSSTLE